MCCTLAEAKYSVRCCKGVNIKTSYTVNISYLHNLCLVLCSTWKKVCVSQDITKREKKVFNLFNPKNQQLPKLKFFLRNSRECYLHFHQVWKNPSQTFFIISSNAQSLALPVVPCHSGNSLYTRRLWYHMCNCQPTVGLTILSLFKFCFHCTKSLF